MKILKFLPIAVVWAATTPVALAAQGMDVQGTWVGVVSLPANPANPNGLKLPFIAHLTQKDEVVSGVLDGIGGTPDVAVLNGKVNGSTLTFNAVRKVNGQDLSFTYTVVATDSGGLHFAITREGSAPLESTTTRLTHSP